MRAIGWASSLLLLLAGSAACRRASTSSAGSSADGSTESFSAPTASEETAPPPPATWTSVTFGAEAGATHRPTAAVEAFPDGRVVFTFAGEVPTYARAPNKVLSEIEEWATTPLPPGEALDAAAPDAGFGAPERYYVRVTVVRAGKTQRALYPADAVPHPVVGVYRDVNRLVNAARHPMPCAKWDGKGDFALAFQAQDFGVVAGPVSRVTIKSDGTITRAAASGAADAELAVVKKATAAPSEIEAVRAAIVAQDLGHYPNVYGGGGEGSNYRSVELTTATAGECPRGFTNEYPADMKPLLSVTAPLGARVAGN